MVTVLPGSAADRAGIKYENRWVALRVAEMLEGKVNRMRLEPPGKSSTGICLLRIRIVLRGTCL